MRIVSFFAGSLLLAQGCALFQNLGGGDDGSASGSGGATSSGSTTSSDGTSSSGTTTSTTSTSHTTGTGGTGGGGGPTGTPIVCADIPIATPEPGAGDVTVRALDHYYSPASIQQLVPRDFSTFEIAALVLSGGAWRAYPGKAMPNGMAVIPGVPEGPYLLALSSASWGRTYLATSSRDVDVGTTVLGRPDAVPAPPAPATTVHATITSPGPSPQQIRALVPGTGSVCASQATSSSQTSVDLDLTCPFLVDGGKGDVLYVVESATVSGADPSYDIVGRVAPLTGVVEVEHAVVPASGTSSPVPATNSLQIDIPGTHFAATAPHLAASAANPSMYATIRTFPGSGETLGLPDPSLVQDNLPSLLAFRPTLGDAVVGPFWYGNPYPSVWGMELEVGLVVDASVSFPGTSQKVATRARVLRREPVGNGCCNDFPFEPLAGPIQDPQVNGATAFETHTGVTTSPTLSWAEPAVGQGFYFHEVGSPGTELEFAL